MLHMEWRHWQFIDQVIAAFPYTFYAFGSRAKGTQKSLSDLDLGYVEPIPISDLSRLNGACEDSDLPFTVDLVDLNAASPAFRQLIAGDLVLLRRGERHRKFLHALKQRYLPLEENADAAFQETESGFMLRGSSRGTSLNLVFDFSGDGGFALEDVVSFMGGKPFTWWRSQPGPGGNKALFQGAKPDSALSLLYASPEDIHEKGAVSPFSIEKMTSDASPDLINQLPKR